MGKARYRVEKDSMGTVDVPLGALWGAQTQRAVDNFPVSGLRMPRQFLRALGLVKAACARINGELGYLDGPLASAIERSANAVASGEYDDQFPIDVFQTGSGTSTNMNANEVIARLASASLDRPVHPNDDVNRGQSSNDVIPTAIHVAASLAIEESLLPALRLLADTIDRKAHTVQGIVTTGRTHLMDALPVRLDQELGGWSAQVRNATARIEGALPGMRELALGGTAVGTGLNTSPEFAGRVAGELARVSGIDFQVKGNFFEGLSSQDASVATSGQLRTLAVSLTKISNDLRWMNSGPLAGLGEISLHSLQPGSSIMPGKVNPVIPEAVAMVCAQVIGNDVTVTIAGQSGNFQLNVMLPIIAHNLLQSIELLSNAAVLLADSAIEGFTVNEENIQRALERNPILVTALNHVIGYEEGAKIAKKAYAEGRSVLEVAREMTDLPEETLRRLLDPRELTGPPPVEETE
ncbi:MAG: class II fumarate hydratase [Gammaproteobacteria bacterium]|jgi:fumarate hydratase class II|nr:class II fumarate hydratase [Gammaproteobacteria bacterium]